MFSNIFNEQCSFVRKKIVLPADLSKKITQMNIIFNFSNDDILKIIIKPFPNKTQEHYMAITRMAKTCGNSIRKLLKLIFQSCLGSETFHNEWEKLIWPQLIKKVITKY